MDNDCRSERQCCQQGTDGNAQSKASGRRGSFAMVVDGEKSQASMAKSNDSNPKPRRSFDRPRRLNCVYRRTCNVQQTTRSERQEAGMHMPSIPRFEDASEKERQQLPAFPARPQPSVGVSATPAQMRPKRERTCNRRHTAKVCRANGACSGSVDQRPQYGGTL